MELSEIITELKNNTEYLSGVTKEFGLVGETELSGLVRSKDQLLSEKKKLSKRLESFGEHTPEQVADMVEDLEELREQLKTGKGDGGGAIDEKKVQRQIRELQTKLDQAGTERETYKSKYIKTQKELMINKTLDAHNVAAPFRKVLSGYLASSGETQELDDGIGLYYNTEKGEVPLDAYAKSFFESEAGRAYIAKPDNSGGGSPGGIGTGSGKTITRDAFSELRPEAQDKILSDGVTITD